MPYEIIGKYRSVPEVIDEADDLEEAKYLQREYQMAFGKEWLITIRKEKKKAAPDLLQACKAIQTFCVFVDSNLRPEQGTGFREAWGMLIEAIAKAEGRE